MPGTGEEHVFSGLKKKTLRSETCTVQYVPGKMMHHFSWFHHFLKPIHHFTGASFLCVTMLLFGSPSFYRNIILLEQLCPPNLSPSFYDSTFKNFSSVHHFTGSLLLHWNYRNEHIICSQNPLAADWTCVFRWETDTAVLPPLFYWIRARNYSVYTLGWWVAEITPTHTMSVQVC